MVRITLEATIVANLTVKYNNRDCINRKCMLAQCPRGGHDSMQDPPVSSNREMPTGTIEA